MVKKEQIDAWKEKYGDVYKVTISGDDYYYRPITRGEYRKLSQGQTPQTMMNPNAVSQMEDKMVEICTLYPENITSSDESKAGVSATLANLIAEASGFNAASEPERL